MGDKKILNESQLRQIVKESVYAILNESEMDEGFFKNLKAGFKGASQGYNTQKFVDSDVNTDYADANANYAAMINGVKTKEDAAKTYQKMISIAKNYEEQAKKLRSKMNAVYDSANIERTQNRVNGKFASGFKNADNNVSNGMGSSVVKGLSDRSIDLGNRRQARYNANQMRSQHGMSPSGSISMGESYDRMLDKVIIESIEKVVNESNVDEGLWDNIKSGLKGFKQGYQTQNMLDTDNYRFQNDAQQRKDRMFARNSMDLLANKIYNKDAKSSGEKMYSMAQKFDEQAKQIRQMAKELAQKWGVSIISKVGEKGPAKYGYGGRNIGGVTAPQTT